MAEIRKALEDLGSKNGTWVDGERLEAPRPLRDGDRILIAEEVITFEALRTPGTTHTAARPSEPRPD